MLGVKLGGKNKKPNIFMLDIVRPICYNKHI